MADRDVGTPDAPVTNMRHRAILMADIVSSTRLYEDLGNVTARRMVGGCLDMLAETVRKFGGSVVKSLGDGIMGSFDSEQSAVWAAVTMCQRSVDRQLELRAGVHCGDVLEEDGDVFGDAVNTTARIAALAKPSEILISSDLRAALPPFMQDIVRRVPPVSVKGKREPIELFAILRSDTGTEDEESQPMRLKRTVEITSSRRSDGRLRLTYAGKTIAVNPKRDLTMGRGPENGLIVASRHASRLHARVFFRQGKFVLVDQSANGTFLVPDRQSKLQILREEAILHGSGHIYLGLDPDASESEPIRYETG